MAVQRLNKIARELNVGISTMVEFLQKKGLGEVKESPNTKVTQEQYEALLKGFSGDVDIKKKSDLISEQRHSKDAKETVVLETGRHTQVDLKEKESNEIPTEIPKSNGPKILGKIDLSPKPRAKVETPEPEVKKVSKVEVAPEKPVVEKAPEVAKSKAETPKVEAPVVETKREEAPAKAESTKTETAPVQEKQPEAEKAPKQEPKAVVEAAPVAPKEVPTPETKTVEAEKVEVKKPATETVKAEEAPKVTEVSPEETYTSSKLDDGVIRVDVKVKENIKVIAKIDLSTLNQRTRPDKKSKEELKKEREKRDTTSTATNNNARKKRKRIVTDKVNIKQQPPHPAHPAHPAKGKPKGRKPIVKKEVNEVDVQKQVKETLARLTNKGSKFNSVKYRREKRDMVHERHEEEMARQQEESKILKVTEFVTANDIANMMSVSVTEIISACMSLGMFVSINQRLDAETIALIAAEFEYEVEFVSVEVQEAIEEKEDDEANLLPRAPIVTVMGHVDHGKTSLLDFIRRANVIAGEAGGITQHIGAYNVTLEDGKKITFLDTPGHEAFTAMRARGAKVTDIAIIIVAADDNVMPQTIEAINHASAAGVPIVFAINKIDKAGANPDRVKEELAKMNYLVEEWGGKYQSQDIAAKTGLNVPELMEKILLEAEMLDMKANPNRMATGSIIESSLDKGRGYVATVLVQNGTLKQGDIILAGSYYGHVKAMFNERGNRVKTAGPAEPVLILGLNGAPTAGDNFNVMEVEKEAREIATKRQQLQREQGVRTQKHITLDEIGRRIAIGNFQELNVVVKGDVDGSIEALSDSLIKLSTDEIQVNVIHKGVGQISESDIMLAAASNALVIGFQVRPSVAARKLAEKEEIDVRLYSVIYQTIDEIKSAMEGMLSPEIKETITSTVEVIETFNINKVGTIAGCMVRDGKINRNSKIRLIRDGIVIHTGTLESLKRFKDDVKEVGKGYDCGLNIAGYNDLKVGDMIESFEETEVRKTL